MKPKIIPRTITALIGIPVLIAIISWARPWQFALVIFLLTLKALHEYFSLVFPEDWGHRAFGIILGALVSCGIVIPAFREASLGLAGLVAVIFAVYLFSGPNLRGRYPRLGWTLLGALYVGYLIPHFSLLYNLPSGSDWIFWLLSVIMIGDSAAYFIGSSFGKRKLSPRISPGKTVEGAWASMAASLCAGVVAGMFLLPHLAWQELLLLALVLNVVGQAGDLFESWIKRSFSVKDSGAILPGHGGLLDRIDSLIFPVALTTYYIKLFHS
ncbi:MAG TPA: phosphatidate cytidylyltransferase [Candidatus Binatia bacterium]|nr:phosphatidate cytidylyltransferase [Candidatus Binatia bacterium]